ncbi:hypothetical protein KIPB_008217, partial [Kipferlia bialata]
FSVPNGYSKQSAVQRRTLNPTWDFELFVIAVEQGASSVRLDVFDFDFLSKNDYLGGLTLDLSPMLHLTKDHVEERSVQIECHPGLRQTPGAPPAEVALRLIYSHDLVYLRSNPPRSMVPDPCFLRFGSRIIWRSVPLFCPQLGVERATLPAMLVVFHSPSMRHSSLSLSVDDIASVRISGDGAVSPGARYVGGAHSQAGPEGEGEADDEEGVVKVEIQLRDESVSVVKFKGQAQADAFVSSFQAVTKGEGEATDDACQSQIAKATSAGDLAQVVRLAKEAQMEGYVEAVSCACFDADPAVLMALLLSLPSIKQRPRVRSSAPAIASPTPLPTTLAKSGSTPLSPVPSALPSGSEAPKLESIIDRPNRRGFPPLHRLLLYSGLAEADMADRFRLCADLLLTFGADTKVLDCRGVSLPNLCRGPFASDLKAQLARRPLGKDQVVDDVLAYARRHQQG